MNFVISQECVPPSLPPPKQINQKPFFSTYFLNMINNWFRKALATADVSNAAVQTVRFSNNKYFLECRSFFSWEVSFNPYQK